MKPAAPTKLLQLLLLLLLVVVAKVSATHKPSTLRPKDYKLQPPIVINTWNFTDANLAAWRQFERNQSRLDVVERGCSQCEIDRCDGTVGWGGSPSETGETTLDAMIMDGETHNVGAVAGLRRVKSAISVARMVLERTNHSLLVGEMATQFALSMGFREESLTSKESRRIQKEWLINKCQPNFWTNVVPNPRHSCGPYKPAPINGDASPHPLRYIKGHDTIGMVALDANLRLACGTSTNGLAHKILGRVGDSPIAGAGSYALRGVGAAASTGDGDIIMRYLLSYQAVENLRRGFGAQEAVDDVITRMVVHSKALSSAGNSCPEAAVILLSVDGSFAAACTGFKEFPFVVSDPYLRLATFVVECSQCS